MKDERFKDLCIGYVLSELSDEERSEFLRELNQRGAEGREELRRTRESFAAISLEASAEEPPQELKDRVMSAAEEEGGDDRLSTEGEPGGGSSGGGSRWGWGLAAAAALAGLVFLGLQNLEQRETLQRVRAQLDSSRQRLARLDTLQDRVGELQRDFLTVASPETRTRLLSATQQQFSGQARVFIDPETGHALLFARNLPVLPPDSVYQLWTIEGGTPKSAGTFTAGEDGQARIEISRAQQALQADAVAVTVEPAPGSKQPTTKPILVASS